MSEALSVPEAITFEQALDLTQTLMAQIQQNQMSEADLEATISALVASENGARGFFVTYSTADSPIPDAPSEAVIRGLQSSPTVVAELLVKNLAMSSAMAITHRRNQNEEMAQGSDRVQRRTINLIEKLQLPAINERAAKLRDCAVTGTGEYETFLNRWHYDAEQRQVIQQQMDRILGAK